jgi:hypothetical protein
MENLNLIEIRDSLLHTNEYKTETEKLAYANGVLDMFNETKGKLCQTEMAMKS